MTTNTGRIFMLAVCPNFSLITAFVTQEGYQVHQNQLLSLKLRLQTVLVRRWGPWGGRGVGCRISVVFESGTKGHNVVCQHSPCNSSDH